MPNKLSSLLIIGLVIFSVLVHRAVYELMDKGFHSFMIQNISIQDATISRDNQFNQIIISATNQAMGNLNKLNIHDLKNKLEQLDLVKKATVQKDFPNTLTVKIQERKPTAIIQTPQNKYTVDQEGYILESTANIAIPTIVAEFGIAINQRQVADEVILSTLQTLSQSIAHNVNGVRINKNRETYFRISELNTLFYIEKNTLNDKFITKAESIKKTLIDQKRIPKTIDIFSAKDTSIGYY